MRGPLFSTTSACGTGLRRSGGFAERNVAARIRVRAAEPGQHSRPGCLAERKGSTRKQARAAGAAPGGAQIAFAAALSTLALATAATGSEAALHLPKPAERTLENGLRVVVFQRPRLPIVQLQLVVPAGAAAETADEAGVARLTAELLRQGTSSRDARAVADELDRLGGTLAASASRDYATVAAAFLSQDLEEGMELVSDVAINPVFPEAEFRRAKSQTLRAISQLARNPRALAEEQVWSLVFEGLPYGRMPFGTAESMGHAGVDQVRGFYHDHYGPDRAMLAIAGDVTPERAFMVAQEWFGRWARNPAAAAPPAPRAAARSRRHIRIVDVPGAEQAEIRLGFVGPGRASADELPISVTNVLFGAGPGSRLARLWSGRKAPGWGWRGSLELTLADAGLFALGASAPHDSVGAAVDLLTAELRRFLDEPPEERALTSARRAVRTAFGIRLEKLGGLLAEWCAADRAGLSAADLESYAARADHVTASDIAAAARRWLDTDRGSIVVVGPAGRIKPQLEPLGPVEVVGPELVAGASTPPAASTAVPPTAEEDRRGRDIVRRAIVAHGGLERLRRIRDSIVEANATLMLEGRTMEGEVRQIRKEPLKMVYTTSFGNVVSVQTLNGDRAWSTPGPGSPGGRRPAGAQDLDSLSVAAMRNGFESDLPHLLLAAAAADSRVAARGHQQVDGLEAEAVEVTEPGGEPRMLYFDASTHRLIAMDQHEAEAGGGARFAARRIYRDYRPVQGIPWPYGEERLLAGQPVMRLTMKRVVLNAGVDETMFEKPEPELPPRPR